MAEKMNPWVVGIVVAVLVFAAFSQGWFGLGTTPVGPDNTIITSAVTLSTSGHDAFNRGTAVTGTAYTKRAGAEFATGITSLNSKESVDVLFVNGSTYHSAYLAGQASNAGDTTLPVAFSMKKNATVTMKVYDAFTEVTQTGTVNATIASAELKTLTLKIQGTAEQSTNDMVCFAETSDATKVDEIVLSGAGVTFKDTNKPSSVTALGVNSKVNAYNVAPIEDGNMREWSVQIKSKAGQDASGSTYRVLCKTKENFIDPVSGAASYDIQDSKGTAKSIASYSFTGNLD